VSKPVAQDFRQARRIAARLQIELTMDDSASREHGSTIDVSANGVYFTSRRYIEPLTKLGMRLLLPGEEGGSEPEALDVRGIVVRIEPEEPTDEIDEYEIACFFTDASPEFRERLGRYVQARF
jgi:hypothetical protein